MPNNILFDKLGPIYDHLFGAQAEKALADPLKLPAEGWLLDLGGGTGRSSAGLAGLVERTLLCDLSMPMLQEAHAKDFKHVVQASATALPFEDGIFARMMVIDALHHMPAQESTVGEMVRVLEKEGRLLIEEPDIRYFAVKLIALMEKLLLMRSKFHTPDEIRLMAEGHGASARVGGDGKGSAWIMVDKEE